MSEYIQVKVDERLFLRTGSMLNNKELQIRFYQLLEDAGWRYIAKQIFEDGEYNTYFSVKEMPKDDPENGIKWIKRGEK